MISCISRVYTDLTVIELGPQLALVVDRCPGLDFVTLQARTAIPLVELR